MPKNMCAFSMLACLLGACNPTPKGACQKARLECRKVHAMERVSSRWAHLILRSVHIPGMRMPRRHVQPKTAPRGECWGTHPWRHGAHTEERAHLRWAHPMPRHVCSKSSTPIVMHTQVCTGTQGSMPRCVRAQGCTSSGLLACPDPGIPLDACKTCAFACAYRCKPDDSGATACPQMPFKCMQALCNQIFTEI